MERVTEEKRRRLAEILEGGIAIIHLDARRDGVVVPAELRGECHLRLNLSFGFSPPDLALGEWGVRETLSFAGRRLACAVPWEAVFAISNPRVQKVWVFPRDVPEELLGNFVPAQSEGEMPRSAIRLVTPLESPAAAVPGAGSNSNRPKLRVVKND